MDQTIENKENKFLVVLRSIGRALKNRTFLYILRRIGSALITLLLLVALIKILFALLPDTKFYDVATYKLYVNKYGETMANNWRNAQLFSAGRVDIDGNRISLIQSIFEYIWWILPIPKSIPIAWSRDYSTVIKWYDCLSYFGRSSTNKKYVLDLLVDRMGISFEVTMISIVITYAIGYPLGIAMAKKPGGVVDRIGNVFIVLNYAIPALVFYLFMQRILGDSNGIFGWAHFGLIYDSNDPSFLQLMPAILCMSFLSIPGVIIWLRRFMVDELNSDYVKFARSKGLSENRIMYTHVLRNAVVPLVRNIPATFIGAIVGSYFVEKIWHIPGTGSLLTDGMTTLDISVVTSLTTIYAGLGMIAFLLGDIVTVFCDPRIKLQVD